MSNVSRDLKKKTLIFHFLSILLTFLPITIWFCIALSKSTEVTRVTLGLSLCIAMILTLANTLLKFSIRSTVWILLIGIYACLKNITALLVIIAVCTVIDEFIVHPLSKHFKNRYIINKEIDKRQGE